jgi:hypothetical protein
MTVLREAAPDLADLVTEERMPFGQARRLRRADWLHRDISQDGDDEPKAVSGRVNFLSRIAPDKRESFREAGTW